MLRIATVAACTALGAFGLVPAAYAAHTVQLNVTDGNGAERYLSCPVGAGTCTVRDGYVAFAIQIGFGSWRPKNTAITVGYQLTDGTALAGQDYLGPTSGSVTIAANATQATVTVPLVVDGVTEPAETLTLRLTSASAPADLSDVGTGTITDGTLLPADCTAVKSNDSVMSLTCTNRPAGQRWHLWVICASIFGGFPYDGNVVTGNGTSSYDCGAELFSQPRFVADA
jgi:hypothetical protein